MPLTSALGQAVMAHLAADSRAVGLLTARQQAAIGRGEIPLANLEVWLSSLASAQPHHDRADHLRRSALFEVVAGHISREIARCENTTLAGACPEWLAAFVVALHYDRTAVITFNYDTLIEATLQSLALQGLAPDGRESHRVMAHSVLGDLPNRIQLEGRRYGPLYAESFALHKLHGSTTWFAQRGGRDPSIVRDDLRIGRWEAPSDATGAPQSGMENVIVPPVADKSNLYGNTSISGIWFEAANALRTATDVALVGYSLPQTDYSAASLLAENVARDAVFTVVNPEPAGVTERLHDVVAGGPIVEVESVEDFAAAFVDRVAADQTIEPDALNGPAESSTIVVGPDGAKHNVVGIHDGILQLGPIERTSPPDPAPPVPIAALRNARHARLDDGAIAPIFAVAPRRHLGEPIALHAGVFRTNHPTHRPL